MMNGGMINDESATLGIIHHSTIHHSSF